MSELIQQWLTISGISESLIQPVSAMIGLILLLTICWISYYITKHLVLKFVHKIVTRTTNEWDDLLISQKVFDRISWLIPAVLLLAFMPFFISANPQLVDALTVFAKIAIALQVARSLSSLLNVANNLFQESSKEKYLPLNATIQLLKLAIYIVAIILAISILIDRSPIYLLSGLGALTAVLLLVFQDTIKGLVASIQISANKMVAPGDWIEMPQYGADGDVLEIALNTVKVQNWDNTVTTIPTYALISESFKNWRGMSSSGGRRIKRSISIDISSIHFCSAELMEKLQKFEFLNEYLNSKNNDISAFHQQKGINDITDPNSRRLTNIGTFRAYISAYLQQHPNVHNDMTCMVRQLKPTEIGVALELYFFSNDINWVNYEAIQADIFDHLFAIAPLFELRIFQTPTGHDWQARA
ncbi:mechanosensitive ion channel family protein [Thalassotalea fonticola]|uniref:Mechanosensitive ion channel family protein n=1 Tax=Thalassotalea fonticola TaxID=3065649 RepID=A0ABZ0GK98_9GAMM|nr:mechanosensitive ion channel family protein [Colwelliaceae bacterium S1-1]